MKNVLFTFLFLIIASILPIQTLAQSAQEFTDGKYQVVLTSVPEIIEDGRNGFIVENVDEMAEAIKKVDTISRKECRRTVEEKFAIEKMVDGYEAAFEKIITSFKK